MQVLREKCPEYKNLKLHESSPCGAPFRQLMKECDDYSFSYYYGEKYKRGEKLNNGAANENLEDLTFENESLDVFITQDVMEHVNNPEKAFSEIARVLKRGGGTYFYDANLSFPENTRQNKSGKWTGNQYSAGNLSW